MVDRKFFSTFTVKVKVGFHALQGKLEPATLKRAYSENNYCLIKISIPANVRFPASFLCLSLPVPFFTISLITGWTVYTEKYKARGPDV